MPCHARSPGRKLPFAACAVHQHSLLHPTRSANGHARRRAPSPLSPSASVALRSDTTLLALNAEFIREHAVTRVEPPPSACYPNETHRHRTTSRPAASLAQRQRRWHYTRCKARCRKWEDSHWLVGSPKSCLWLAFPEFGRPFLFCLMFCGLEHCAFRVFRHMIR